VVGLENDTKDKVDVDHQPWQSQGRGEGGAGLMHSFALNNAQASDFSG
jgi:hypothetical protein